MKITKSGYRLWIIDYRPKAIFSGLLAVVIVLIFFSCNNSGNGNHTSKDYDRVIDSTNHLVEAQKDEKAVRFMDSSTTHYTNLNVIQKFRYLSVNYNYYFHIKNDMEKSMIYADSILALFDTPEKKVKFLPHYDQAFFLKGDVFFNQEKYNEAYRYFYQGKLIANKSITDCTLSDFSYRMGMIMYKQENYSLAADNFINATTETRNCDLTFGNFYRIQELTSNTGLAYSKIKQFDKALLYYQRALDFINKNGYQFETRPHMLDAARGVIYGNQANIYIKQNSLLLATRLLKQSIEINLRKGNDNNDAALSELKLAQIYYNENKLDDLGNLLTVLRKQLDTIKNKDAETDLNHMQANYFVKRNDTKTAVVYFQRYDALKDSISNANKALKDADISQQIKHLEKDNEFNNMKKDIELRDTYLKLGGVFGLMLLLIIFLILLNWQKSHKNIRVLAKLNHQINDQNATLELALEEVRFSSEEKDRILRTVAHDLRNPIGGIASLTQSMSEDNYTSSQKELITLIRETSINSIELINEILEAADNRTATLNKELVEINALVARSTELLHFKAAEKDQQLISRLLETPLEICISREKIWRVISNLLSNAIKFSPKGGTININVTTGEKFVEIAVKDAGIGVPVNMRDKVFNMFTDAKRLGTAGEKSFGLGLSICKQIIESHGGKIGLIANEDKGTTFYIHLPLVVHGS